MCDVGQNAFDKINERFHKTGLKLGKWYVLNKCYFNIAKKFDLFYESQFCYFFQNVQI